MCQMATEPEHRDQLNKPPTSRRQGSSDWDDAEIVIGIRYTKPGTPLDDLLRKQQTEVLLELLSADQQSK